MTDDLTPAASDRVGVRTDRSASPVPVQHRRPSGEDFMLVAGRGPQARVVLDL